MAPPRRGFTADFFPPALELTPTGDAFAGGAYGFAAQTGDSGAERRVFQLMREEARVGVRHSPVVGLVTEAEGLAAATFAGPGAEVGADMGARLRYASATEREPVWEQAQAGLRWRSTPPPSLDARPFGIALQLRYTGVAPERQPLLVSELPTMRGGYHLALTGGGSLWPSVLEVAGSGSYHFDRDSGLREGEAGLDVGAPRLFASASGMWLGGSAGEGWLRTRTLYAQIDNRQLRALRVLARATVTGSELPGTGATSTELAGHLQLDARLSPQLRLRGRASLRLPLLIQGMSPPVGASNLAIVSGADLLWLL